MRLDSVAGRLWLTLKATGIAVLLLALSPTQLRAVEANPFGVNAHVPTQQELVRVAEAGIGWVRVDFVWYSIEKSRGVFTWKTHDDMVNAATALGLEVYATLAYTPTGPTQEDRRIPQQATGKETCHQKTRRIGTASSMRSCLATGPSPPLGDVE